MNLLVTGNQGYIGSVLTSMLINKGYVVTGLDTDFYFDNILEPTRQVQRQIKKDIRDVEESDLNGIDGILHLSALCNDPLGELNPSLTDDINLHATLSLAKLAKRKGIPRLVFVSSQSMYGVSNTDEELDEDNSEKNPVTAYARTKWEAEIGLKLLNSPEFTVVCLRPSTVFGASPKLRCDIVFNNFVACAYTTGKIEIKSDGTPWRPVVHVQDVSKAIIAAFEAPIDLVSGESFNVGIPNGNFTVRDLAEAAQKVVSGSSLTFTGEHGKDSRTYRVSFDKILRVLRDYYKPEWTLEKGGRELLDFFQRSDFNTDLFQGRTCNRLKQVDFLMRNHKLSKDLRWK